MYSSFTVCQEELHAYKEKAHVYNLIKIFCLDEHFVIVSIGQIIIHHDLHFMLKDVAFWWYLQSMLQLNICMPNKLQKPWGSFAEKTTTLFSCK